MKTLTIDIKDHPENGTVFHRKAARGIILQENNCLLVTTKFGEYKFPGGGVETGETLENALIREVREETGCVISRDSIRECGAVRERRRGITADILEMESRYFFCQPEAEGRERRLDDYEANYEFRAVWIPLEKALEKNRTLLGLEECPWVTRDTKVMEYLLERTEDIC